jgi:hypothetical protein
VPFPSSHSPANSCCILLHRVQRCVPRRTCRPLACSQKNNRIRRQLAKGDYIAEQTVVAANTAAGWPTARGDSMTKAAACGTRSDSKRRVRPGPMSPP